MLNEGNPVDYDPVTDPAAPEPTHAHVPRQLQPIIPIHFNPFQQPQAFT